MATANTPTGTAHTAVAQFVMMVRSFAQRQPVWGDRIDYEVRPGYEFDLIRIATEAYGSDIARRWGWIAVMAAAGMDSVEQPLRPQTIVLPLATQGDEMARACGLITSPWERPAGYDANPLST